MRPEDVANAIDAVREHTNSDIITLWIPNDNYIVVIDTDGNEWTVDIHYSKVVFVFTEVI